MGARFTLRRRAGGVLLHPTSLPGPHGSGDLGPAARAFADFLAGAEQGWWQMLPVGPVDGGAGWSPYVALSAFAGNPLLIGLHPLAEEGLLAPADLEGALPPGRADFPAAARFREERLRRAFAAFERQPADGEAFGAFCAANSGWLDDYALFGALRRRFGGAPWTAWPAEIRDRDPGALARARRGLAGEERFERFCQFLFDRQWEALRRHARGRGVGLIGDVPIYVSLDSADVWAHPDLFRLGPGGRPEAVAGVPPDYFNEAGQTWGNPLYRWEALRARGYDWWIERLRRSFARFDAVRLDHFIGFVRYWEIPAGAASAKEGGWREGPGAEFFERALAALGPIELIAEDLGSVTEEVFALRERFGFPGMRVLQFGFDGDPDNMHLPANHPVRCVAYTGTHDNNTAAGWFAGSDLERANESPEGFRLAREAALKLFGCDAKQIHWGMIRAAYASRADLTVVPLQDLLGLGSEARMNRPGMPDGNWTWRTEEEALGGAPAARLAALARAYGRAGEEEPSAGKPVRMGRPPGAHPPAAGE